MWRNSDFMHVINQPSTPSDRILNTNAIMYMGLYKLQPYESYKNHSIVKEENSGIV